MCAISWPIAEISTSSELSVSSDSGRMIASPAVTGPETPRENSNFALGTWRASPQRLQTRLRRGEISLGRAERRNRAVCTAALASLVSRYRRNRKYAPTRRVEVLAATETLRRDAVGSGDGEGSEARGAWE